MAAGTENALFRRMSEWERRFQSSNRPNANEESQSDVGDKLSLARMRAIQMRRKQSRTTPEVQAAADLGIDGAAGQLPHLETIQSSFGTHDVSQVKAHTDTAAARSTSAMGAEAFATGDHVAFQGAPSLHTAAHEAAHVVQQRGGVQLMGGVGREGDAYEQHADAVADRVVQGRSAEDLLDGCSGSSGDAGAPIQKKETNKKPRQKKAAPPSFEQLRKEIATYVQTRIRDTDELLRALRVYEQINLPDFGPKPDPSPGVHQDPPYARNQKVPEEKPEWAKPPQPPAGPEIPQGNGPRDAGSDRPGTHIVTLTLPFEEMQAIEAARPVIKATISGLEKAAGALAGVLASLSDVDLSIHIESPSLNNAVNSGMKAVGEKVVSVVKTVQKATSAISEAGSLFEKGLRGFISVMEALSKRPASDEKSKKSPAKPVSPPASRPEPPKTPKKVNDAAQELPKLGEKLKSILQSEQRERLKILGMIEWDLGDIQDDIDEDRKNKTITDEEAEKLFAELQALRESCKEVKERSPADQLPQKTEDKARSAPADDD